MGKGARKFVCGRNLKWLALLAGSILVDGVHACTQHWRSSEAA
jgi:hypothetical protein